MAPTSASATALPMVGAATPMAAGVVPVSKDEEENVMEKVAQIAPRPRGPLKTLAPAMPSKVLATLHEDWNFMDPEAERMLNWIRSVDVFHEFAHARDPFYVHLRGTWQMLSCWNQPQEICRAGLLHSGYSRSGFNFRFFDIQDPESRPKMAAALGKGAEDLVFKYCSTWDQLGWGPSVFAGKIFDPKGHDIPSRLKPGETIHVSAEDMAKIMVVIVADVADQLTEVFTYLDIYHHEDPELNWPGSGQPGIGLHWFSKGLRAARPYLEVVPPIFNGCTETIAEKVEREARDLYWETMQNEGKMTVDEREAAYRRVSELNPYVAEPHVMLSQELYRKHAFAEAVHEAASALEIFYQWGTCWDKRHSFAQWVGFSRMMVLRSKRREQGLLSLPSKKILEFEHEVKAEELGYDPETRVTFLQDLLKGFADTTERAPRSRL